VIVDEAGALIEQWRQEIPLAHRYQIRQDPDSSGATAVGVRECPKSNRSGHCGNCSLAQWGGEPGFNMYKIRELRTPRGCEFGPDQKPLRRARNPIRIPKEDFRVGPEIRVGHTVFAASVLGYRDVVIHAWTCRTANLYPFRRDKQGKQAPETNEEILD